MQTTYCGYVLEGETLLAAEIRADPEGFTNRAHFCAGDSERRWVEAALRGYASSGWQTWILQFIPEGEKCCGRLIDCHEFFPVSIAATGAGIAWCGRRARQS